MGEVVNPAVVDRFFDLAAPFGLARDSFVSNYATTETSVITTGHSRRGLWIDHIDPDAFAEGRATPADGANRVSFVSNGPVIDGVSMKLVDADGVAVPERVIGNIFVRSPAMMSNYFGALGTIDWHPTRDRGYVVDGELFVVGRMEDLVIVRGVNLSTVGIEAAAAAALPVGFNAFAIGVPGGSSQDIVVVVSRPVGAAPLDPSDDLRRELWNRMGLSVREVLFIPEDDIPRSSGKVERAVIRKRYLSGELHG